MPVACPCLKNYWSQEKTSGLSVLAKCFDFVPMELLQNVHIGLDPSGEENGATTRGDYDYWHYCCDGLDDRGWGCGYRTLQTLCSWIKYHLQKGQSVSAGTSQSGRGAAETTCATNRTETSAEDSHDAPSDSAAGILVTDSADDNARDTFQISVIASGDSTESFTLPSASSADGASSWCGVEHSTGNSCDDAGFAAHTQTKSVAEEAEKVPCKIVHVGQGSELINHLATLQDHFRQFGSPVMMGGDTDASSKGVLGVRLNPPALLVVDPHYVGVCKTAASLQSSGWVKWVHVEDFHKTSFYNMCLPQLAA
ncbi:hypothetical protein BaRGS_00013894 [Batillaria attramentaria]|uniref:UFSP1/2/DUB catalytic domain-containing protein n=1 Tax=Batillaria attramentaria TaxID=370345 RepID=A0ABD0L5Y9_9CAEN